MMHNFLGLPQHTFQDIWPIERVFVYLHQHSSQHFIRSVYLL